MRMEIQGGWGNPCRRGYLFHYEKTGAVSCGSGSSVRRLAGGKKTDPQTMCPAQYCNLCTTGCTGVSDQFRKVGSDRQSAVPVLPAGLRFFSLCLYQERL